MEVQKVNPVDLVTSPIGPTGPTGPTGAAGPDTNFSTSNSNSIAADGEGFLNTTNTNAKYLAAGNQLYVKGSNPGYLDIINVAKNGATYKLSVTPSTFSAPVSWTAGNPTLIVGYQGTSGEHIIERGNPGQASPLVLSSMNTIHHYTNTSPSTFIDISTTMLEDAVYEVFFSVKGTSSANNDIILYPNYNSGYGASAFYVSVQQFTTPGNNLIYGSGNANGFYFDLVGGFLGWDPVGKITIFNNRSAKKVTYQASDTTGVGHGSGYWTNGAGFSATSASNIVFNTTTIWSNVGRLTFGPSYSSWNIWVRRVA